MGPERATHRHKSSGPTSVISDYTLGSWAQQTRSGCACTILLTHPKPSSWSDQRVPPHHLPSASVPLMSHLSHMLLPSRSVLLTSSPQQTLRYHVSLSSPQVCSPFPSLSRLIPGAAAPPPAAGGFFPGSAVPGVHRRQLSLPCLL